MGGRAVAETMIRFDAHAGGLFCAPALERMRHALDGSAGSLESAHKQIYALAGAEPADTFVFTSSGAEAINQVHWSIFLEKARKEGKCHFVTSAAEEAPTMQSLKRLEELGCYVHIAPLLPNGQVDIAKLEELLTPRTALLSLSIAQGLTGVMESVEEIAELAKQKKVLLHLDGTYSLGKLPSPFSSLPIDYLTFSGDPLHGPLSSGALFAKKGRPLSPLIMGGSFQGGLRGGALDLPSLFSLAAACSHALLAMDAMGLEGARLRDLLETLVLREIPNAVVLFSKTPRLPNVSLLSFPGVHQEMLSYALERKRLSLSIGGSYAPHLHRVLMSSGVEERQAKSTVSLSLSRFQTEEEIEKGALILIETVRSLQPLTEDLFS
jgi:cysteine desulfurase